MDQQLIFLFLAAALMVTLMLLGMCNLSKGKVPGDIFSAGVAEDKTQTRVPRSTTEGSRGIEANNLPVHAGENPAASTEIPPGTKDKCLKKIREALDRTRNTTL